MANLLTTRKHLIPDALSHNSGIITATFGTQSYNLTIPALTANTLYFLYLVTLSGITAVVQSAAVPSSYIASNSGAILIGAYYANGGPPNLVSTAATAIAFGSFVNIEGVPVSGWVQDNMIPSATTTPPTKATARVNDFFRWQRIGDSVQFHWDYHHNTNTGATAGSGTYLFPIPTAFTVDNAFAPSGADGNVRSFRGAAGGQASGDGPGFVKMYNSTNLLLSTSVAGALPLVPNASTSNAMNAAAWAAGFSTELIKMSNLSNTPLKDL